MKSKHRSKLKVVLALENVLPFQNNILWHTCNQGFLNPCCNALLSDCVREADVSSICGEK